MLRLDGLHASYGGAPVLQGVSLHVDKGEAVALLGPNGAGKSTLLAAVTGTIAQRRGGIAFEERSISTLKSHDIVAQGVALVPEGRLVFAPFSVEDNLRLGAVRLRGEAKERYDYVYGLFPRLKERRAQIAGTLSGGERQMLAVGRALMSGPKLLMLDEPSLGLAPLVVRDIFGTIERLRGEGVSILLVEQNARAALQVADHGYVLETGEFVLDGPAESLARNSRVIETYLGALKQS